MTWSAVSSAWIRFDYGHLLPFLARLPVPWGQFLATWRGRLYAALKRDWRQFSFDDTELDLRTRQTLRELMPAASARHIRRTLRRRYVMQSLEELEACWLQYRHFNDWPVEYVGLEPVLDMVKQHGRAVFVTAHFASSIVGTIFLQKLGLPILGMSSKVVEDPRVHPAIGRFYRRKYAAMNPYLNGGEVLDRQGNSRRFVKFVQQGGAVVIVGDLPPDPQELPYEVDFIGQRRAFASGAARLAQMANVPLVAFVCERTAAGYRVTFSTPGAAPFALFERHIANDPGAWWAADLLPLLPLVHPPHDLAP